jgi:hypothetical protein
MPNLEFERDLGRGRQGEVKEKAAGLSTEVMEEVGVIPEDGVEGEGEIGVEMEGI